MQKPMTLSELWTTFNEQGMSDYVVVYLRLLVSKELKKNADFFQFFMEDGKTVEEFCLTEVEPMYRESDHIHITALTRGALVKICAGIFFPVRQREHSTYDVCLGIQMGYPVLGLQHNIRCMGGCVDSFV